jgi:hypothetical protein
MASLYPLLVYFHPTNFKFPSTPLLFGFERTLPLATAYRLSLFTPPHLPPERKQTETYAPEAPAPVKRVKKAKAKASPVKAKKEKKVGPKRANAYMMFSTDARAATIAKNPDAAFGEVGKLLGAQWGKLSEAQKGEWKKKADAQTAKNAKEFAKKQK